MRREGEKEREGREGGRGREGEKERAKESGRELRRVRERGGGGGLCVGVCRFV